MGHADSRTTREIYTHTTKRMIDSALAAAAEALDEQVSPPIGSPRAEDAGFRDGLEKGRAWDLRCCKRAGRDSNPRPSDP